VAEKGTREIAADGLTVTPGFVDINVEDGEHTGTRAGAVLRHAH
jgi:N-acyl-D-aspartate/D-glutamate deacylase